jgi:hypothetical protein
VVRSGVDAVAPLPEALEAPLDMPLADTPWSTVERGLPVVAGAGGDWGLTGGWFVAGVVVGAGFLTSLPSRSPVFVPLLALVVVVVVVVGGCSLPWVGVWADPACLVPLWWPELPVCPLPVSPLLASPGLGAPPPGLAGATTKPAGTSTMAPSPRRASTSAGVWVLRDVCGSPSRGSGLVGT